MEEQAPAEVADARAGLCNLGRSERQQPLADLDYHEDSSAEADLNVICSSDGKLIEVQGAAEKAPFAVEQFHEVVAVGQRACEGIDKLQRQALGI